MNFLKEGADKYNLINMTEFDLRTKSIGDTLSEIDKYADQILAEGDVVATTTD